MNYNSNREFTWTISIYSSRWRMLVAVFSTEAHGKFQRDHAEGRGKEHLRLADEEQSESSLSLRAVLPRGTRRKLERR